MSEPSASAKTGPAAGRRRERDGDEGLGTHFNELVGLVIAYVKQETVEPVKGLARFVAWGVAGAILIAAGGAMLTLAAVRAAQSETGRHLTGDLNWVPYMGGVLVAGIGAAWAVTRIFRTAR